MKSFSFKKSMPYVYFGLFSMVAGVGLLMPSTSFAACARQLGTTTGNDGNSAVIPTGHINILSEYLQPTGSILTTTTVYPGRNKLAGDETVLFICDAADENELFEIIGLNEDRVGSYFNVGIPDFYYTWFKYVAVRLTHLNSGIIYSTTWQKVPLKNFERVGEKIHVKGRHLSAVKVDLMKVNTLPPLRETGVSIWCGNNNNEGTGISKLPTNSKTDYTCKQPLAYSVFSGPGIGDNNLPGVSVKTFTGWPKNWYGVTLTGGATLSAIPSCVIRNSTPTVEFDPISVQELKSGITRTEPFNVVIECDKLTQAGVAANQTAIGLQVSELAYQRALQLGNLINAKGGVSYLLSDAYGADHMAEGVGIQIADAARPTIPLNFVGWNACMSNGTACPADGNLAGWYAINDGTYNPQPGGDPSTSMVTKKYLATLKPIPGEQIKAGEVLARAYILVKIQ